MAQSGKIMRKTFGRLEMIRTRSFAVVPVVIFLSACGPEYDDLANFPNAAGPIVCFGDSITRGYGASPGQNYPDRLAARLGMPVVNAGRDGDTTATALARIDEVLALQPRLTIVELGGNDLLAKTPKNQVFRNLDRIVARLVAGGSMVTVVHAKFGLFLDDPYLDGYREIADKHGALFVQDVLDDILGNPARMYDQIHPNDEGYALIAERVAQVAAPLLEASAASGKVTD